MEMVTEIIVAIITSVFSLDDIWLTAKLRAVPIDSGGSQEGELRRVK